MCCYLGVMTLLVWNEECGRGRKAISPAAPVSPSQPGGVGILCLVGREFQDKLYKDDEVQWGI